jgi:uncharacterized surface protein with fasciclin (FAS1) repeats
MKITGAPNEVIFQDDSTIYNPPGTDFIDCWGGHYPGAIGQEFDAHSAPYTTALDTIGLLQELSDDTKNGGHSPSFNTFLSVLSTTGLNDLLTAQGPYILFPPSDAAFAALSPEQRAALLADPQALVAMLRGLIVPGYYLPGALGGGPYHAKSTVTNLLGQPLVLQSGDKFTINGAAMGDDYYVMTANGSRVFYRINQVPLPASPPGMPTTGARDGGPWNLIALIVAGLVALLTGGLLRRRATAPR